MRYWIIVLCLMLLFTGCKKKKAELPFMQYQKEAQLAIEALEKLTKYDLDHANLATYQKELKRCEDVVLKFINGSTASAELESRRSIEASLQDFRIVGDLLKKREKRDNTRFSSDKLFADTDTELFAKVKERYQLGAELVIATKRYYYLDTLIHEVWRSSQRQVERSKSRLADELEEEEKAAKAARAAKKATPKPTPTESEDDPPPKPDNREIPDK